MKKMKIKRLISAIPLFFLLSAHAGTTRSVLSVQISDKLPPGFCVVTMAELGKIGHFVASNNVSTFGSKASAPQEWGSTADTGIRPTRVNVDVASISSEVEIRPIATNIAGSTVALDGHESSLVAMVNAQGLPVDGVGLSTSAQWLGDSAGSAVVVYNRDASNGNLTLKSTHHFTGAAIKVLLSPGKYAFFISPGFAFSAANSAAAFKWHFNNKGKHWPFEMLCVARPQ